jgi:hypothetical protein
MKNSRDKIRMVIYFTFLFTGNQYWQIYEFLLVYTEKWMA